MANSSSSELKEIPLLTFNSLYNLLREEKKNKLLQKLPEGFYTSMEQFFESKKKEIEKLKTSTEKDKLKKERYVLNNSKKIVNEFLSLRCQKISNVAINNSLFGEDSMSKKEILEEEESFFDKIKEATLKFKGGKIKDE